MEIQRDNGETQYITINTSNGIVCLQFRETSILSSLTVPDLQSLSFPFPWIDKFPAFRWKYEHGVLYDALENVAVEFDPSWAETESDGTFYYNKSIFSLLYDCLKPDDYGPFDGIKTVWVIDYTLKRYGGEWDDPNCKTFRVGNRLFTEVNVTTIDWGTTAGPFHEIEGESNTTKNWYRARGPTAVGLGHALNDFTMFRHQKFNFMTETEYANTSSYDETEDKDLKFFRVLGCEIVGEDGLWEPLETLPAGVQSAQEECGSDTGAMQGGCVQQLTKNMVGGDGLQESLEKLTTT